MTPEERMLIKGITDRLDAIESRQEVIRTENRADHQIMFDEIHSIAQDGCVVGKANAKSIQELKDQPTKTINVGSAVASILAAIAAVWAVFFGGR